MLIAWLLTDTENKQTLLLFIHVTINSNENDNVSVILYNIKKYR